MGQMGSRDIRGKFPLDKVMKASYPKLGVAPGNSVFVSYRDVIEEPYDEFAVPRKQKPA